MNELLSRTMLAVLRVLARVRRAGVGDDDRGDVPGWVLVTLMTAGLVSGLWLIAQDQLARMLDQALTSVTGP